MARPALQRLLADVAGRRIDVVVVYKVDRLTRSLADFARIIETFDGHGVSFVSITQQFNTTTSMGRLTLNILLSFAQFEREVTGERIRDKIAAARAKGLWMGGYVPLGYDVENKRLVVNPVEAATVRLIFERYLALGCVARLKAELDARGIVSKIRGHTTGTRLGGQPFSRGALYRLLANRVYIGEAVHKGKAYPGEHEPIIDRALFAAVQDSLAGRRIARTNGARTAEPSLLGGLLLDAQGERMSPSHAVKSGRRYRYYVTQSLLQDRARQAGQVMRVPAHDIEAAVVSALRGLLEDPGALHDWLSCLVSDLAELQSLLRAGTELAARWSSLPPSRIRTLVRAAVVRVVLLDDRIEVVIAPARLRDVLDHRATNPLSPSEPGRTVTLALDIQLRRCGRETKLILPGRAADARPARPNPALIKALARAHLWFEQLRSGRAPSIRHIAKTERLTDRYVARILQLAFLAPDIQDAVLHGAQPPDLTIEHLRAPLPLVWSEQRRVLGFPQSPCDHRASRSTWTPPPQAFASGSRPSPRSPGTRPSAAAAACGVAGLRLAHQERSRLSCERTAWIAAAQPLR